MPPLSYEKQELNNINKELNLGFKAHFLYFQEKGLFTPLLLFFNLAREAFTFIYEEQSFDKERKI